MVRTQTLAEVTKSYKCHFELVIYFFSLGFFHLKGLCSALNANISLTLVLVIFHPTTFYGLILIYHNKPNWQN